VLTTAQFLPVLETASVELADTQRPLIVNVEELPAPTADPGNLPLRCDVRDPVPPDPPPPPGRAMAGRSEAPVPSTRNQKGPPFTIERRAFACSRPGRTKWAQTVSNRRHLLCKPCLVIMALTCGPLTSWCSATHRPPLTANARCFPPHLARIWHGPRSGRQPVGMRWDHGSHPLDRALQVF